METRDKKQIEQRLKKVDRSLWSSLTKSQRERVVEDYYKLSDPSELEIPELHKRIWQRSEAMELVTLGVVLGLIGGLAANLLDRAFVKYGVIYDVAITVAFLIILFGFSKLADYMVTFELRRSNVLRRLIKEGSA